MFSAPLQIGSKLLFQQPSPPEGNSGQTPNRIDLSDLIRKALEGASVNQDGTLVLQSNIPYDTTPVESPDGGPVTPKAPTTMGGNPTFTTPYEDILNSWDEIFKPKEEETKPEIEKKKQKKKGPSHFSEKAAERRRARAKIGRDAHKKDIAERQARMGENRKNAIEKEKRDRDKKDKADRDRKKARANAKKNREAKANVVFHQEQEGQEDDLFSYSKS